MSNFEILQLADSIHRKTCPDDYDSNGKIKTGDSVTRRFNFVFYCLCDSIHRILENPDDPFEKIKNISLI